MSAVEEIRQQEYAYSLPVRQCQALPVFGWCTDACYMGKRCIQGQCNCWEEVGLKLEKMHKQAEEILHQEMVERERLHQQAVVRAQRWAVLVQRLRAGTIRVTMPGKCFASEYSICDSQMNGTPVDGVFQVQDVNPAVLFCKKCAQELNDCGMLVSHI